MTDEQAGQDRERLAALERQLSGLRSDMERLRAELAALRGTNLASAAPQSATPRPTEPVVRAAAAPAPTLPLGNLGLGSNPGGAQAAESPKAAPAAPRPSGAGPTSGLPPRTAPPKAATGDIEQLIGRYGTLVVATLALLLGLGAFLQWAIARGMLGPEVRVALGAVAAVVLAVLGLRMRKTGSIRYGNALLVIALAIVHLVSWAAGPSLGLVPPYLALGVAAVASVGLAWLALREGEEFLFLLGLGGALFAPFVTVVGEGGPGQLLIFGGLLISAAIVALRDPEWRIAPRLISMFALWYMIAGADAYRTDMPQAVHYWPAAFGLALAFVALVLGAQGVRRGILRGMLFLVFLAIIPAGATDSLSEWTAVVYAVFGTLTAHAMRRRNAAAGEEDSWYEVVALPLLFLVAAVFTGDRFKEIEGTYTAAGWIALTAAFLYLDGEAARARHLAVILTATFLGALNQYANGEERLTTAMAAVAVLSLYTLARARGPALFLPVGLSLAFGSMTAALSLVERAAWDYTPFVNLPAAAAATIVVAWCMFSWLAHRSLESDESADMFDGAGLARLFLVAGPIALFLWVRAELAEAYSRDIATFLLITYYALAGVGLILLGRARAVSALRQTGLVLALFAAFKAVLESSGLDQVGFRVGSYLVVGVFLLGVGYLYRVSAAQPDEAAPT